MSYQIELKERFENKWWRLNNLYWVIDWNGNKVRFKCNPLQEKFYNDLWHLNMLLKARQFGGTTFTDIYFLDDCLFINNIEAGIIAHNREDAQKIFRRKVKYPYDNLPDKLKEERSLTTDSRQELAFSNGSIIYVATSIRSGTVQRLHISEHGKICRRYPEKAEEIKTGSLNAIHPGQIVVIESTAEGRYGDFYEFCKKAQDNELAGKELTNMDFKFHFYPWFWDKKNVMNPKGVVLTADDKNYFSELESKEVKGPDGSPHKFTDAQKAWYVKKAEIMNSGDTNKMYQEFPSTPEEAFMATIQGAYFSKEMTHIRKNKQIRLVPYDPKLPVNTGWDLGHDDENAIVFHQGHIYENRIIDVYANNGYGLSHYVKTLNEKGYVYGSHYLPHDISVTELGTGKTRLETLQGLMPGSRIVVVPKIEDLKDGIEAVRNFIPTCWFDEEKSADLVRACDEYQREPDDKHGGFKDHPLKNWTRHYVDALRSLVMGYNSGPSKKTRRTRRRRNARVV